MFFTFVPTERRITSSELLCFISTFLPSLPFIDFVLMMKLIQFKSCKDLQVTAGLGNQFSDLSQPSFFHPGAVLEGRGGLALRYATGQTRPRSIIGALITREDLK